MFWVGINVEFAKNTTPQLCQVKIKYLKKESIQDKNVNGIKTLENLSSMKNNFKTNELFIKAFEQSGLNQIQFSKLINKSQPNTWAYLNNIHEIRYSEFERYMNILGQKFEIQIKEDKKNLDLIYELKKKEISLIKEFSKENEYEKKYIIQKKIEAIKILIDE